MNLNDLLLDLLGRLQAGNNTLLIGYDEASNWPQGALDTLTNARLFAVASPTKSLVCDGCEEECSMPVRMIPGNHARAFIVCDKRDDTERIPVALERLKQWQMSESAVVRILLGAAEDYPITEQQTREYLPTLPLHKILSFDQGQLQVDTGKLVQHLLPKNETAQPNRIALTGDHWLITFQGKTSTFNNTKGLRYIAYLIRNQGKDVHVSELYYAIAPSDSEAVDPIYSTLSPKQLEGMGLSVGDLGDAGDTLTLESEQILKRKVESLEEQIEEAKEFDNEEKQLELEEQQETILSYIAAERGLGGRTRKASSNHKRMVDSVSKCIRSDINKIKETFPELGSHICCIKMGSAYKYAPQPKMEWT